MRIPSHLFSVCENIRHNVLLFFVLCASLMLSSCHTTLYNAAKEGDVETVRQELAIGASAKDKNAAADVAYEKGYTSVLDE